MNRSTPKYVFLHLLVMGALYLSAFSFITLLFQYVNFYFPDQLDFYYKGVFDNIHRSTAALVILFPVYLLTSWLLAKDFKIQPELKGFRLRKWLIYLTLFLAAVAVIGDLVTLVFSFLSGELTSRFLLKVLIVFVTAGAVFGYYLAEVRDKVSLKINKIFAAGSLIIVLLVIIAGFWIVGSPAYQRQLRLDENRVNDLQILQSEVVNYWINKDELPNSLGDLKNTISGFVPPVDPETGSVYSYRVLGPLTFELCAEFKAASLGQTSQSVLKPLRPVGQLGPYQQNWDHGAGRVCFERKIDPEFYPKIKR